MEIFSDLDAQRMLDDSVGVVQSLGTTRLLLRQPRPLDTTVGSKDGLDQDYKTPLVTSTTASYRERILEAKIRSMNDYEVSATGVGELQLGDLVATVDPRYYEDPIQPIQLLDEIRFAQMVFVQGAGSVQAGWDYIIRGIHPAWAKNTCVQLKLILRRKKTASEGASPLPSV